MVTVLLVKAARMNDELVRAWLELFNEGRHWRTPADWERDLKWSVREGLITDAERATISRGIWSATNYGVVQY